MKKKLIILAAGRGERLLPLTSNIPKCMLPLAGKNLLEWQIINAKKVGFDEEDIIVIAGYKAEMIPTGKWTIIVNPRYAQTNMLRTLWCAEHLFGRGIVVSYGDIAYEVDVLENVLSCDHDIGVVIDHNWKPYWERRFENILDDAETLKLGDNGNIIEIGQKTKRIEDIQGQYIGLMVFQNNGLSALRSKFEREPPPTAGQAQNSRIDTLYMTDMLQELIGDGIPVNEIPVNGKWIEIDNLKDFNLAQTFCRSIMGSLHIKRT